MVEAGAGGQRGAAAGRGEEVLEHGDMLCSEVGHLVTDLYYVYTLKNNINCNFVLSVTTESISGSHISCSVHCLHYVKLHFLIYYIDIH